MRGVAASEAKEVLNILRMLHESLLTMQPRCLSHSTWSGLGLGQG